MRDGNVDYQKNFSLKINLESTIHAKVFSAEFVVYFLVDSFRFSQSIRCSCMTGGVHSVAYLIIRALQKFTEK
jgi:hypothetical protein